MSEALFHAGEPWFDTDGVLINAHGGGVLNHEGTYYWFGEHKIAGPEGNRAHVGVRVYRSTNLRDWENAGVALAVSSDPTSEIAAGCILERPKVIHNASTGKFVMWFHLEPKGVGYASARSGVAVADQPCGPYRYIGSIRPNARVWPKNVAAESRRLLLVPEFDVLRKFSFRGDREPDFPAELLFRRDFADGQMARDMTLFVDDDGTAYHVYASEENGTLHVSRLTDNYLGCAGQYVRLFPGEFREAPALMKRHGRYYLFTSGCTGWVPNPLRVATALSIWGPWADLGNPCRGTPAEIETTFFSQPSSVLKLRESPDAFVFIADRWCPENPIDGCYVWIQLRFEHDRPVLEPPRNAHQSET